MQYRKFGKTDLNISALGFGCMRFPIFDNDSSKINEDEAIKMVRHSIDQGINYVDTAYPYHQGQSELVVGKALKSGYREKVHLATKLPVWLCKTYEDFDKYLNEQLEKLQTDHIDFYLVHALNKKTWKNINDLGIFKFLDRAIEDGRIKYAGFSFHDDLDLFKEIVDAYNWTFCQIQLNYMDENYQAGLEGLKYASERDLAVIVMEPLKGGKLAKEPQGDIKELWNQYNVEKTAADLALRWVWNFSEVNLLLSGMSTMEQVKENLITADDALPNSLTKNELELIDGLKEIYNGRTKVDCTGCGYCVPCPQEVVIPDIFDVYNELSIYGTDKESRGFYSRISKNKKDASLCVECGQCEDACPQNIEIITKLKEAHDVLQES